MISVVAALACVLLAPTVAIADQARWSIFTPPAGALSIAVTGAPTLERRSTPTIVGLVKTRIWHSVLGERQYWISHTTLPPIAAFFSPRSMVYDKSRDNLMRELGAVPISFIEHDGELLERELWYRIPGTNGAPSRVGRIGMRLVGDTLVAVNASVKEGNEASLDGFFHYVRGVPGTDACAASC